MPRATVWGGPALSGYLRIVSQDPRRAATAVQQLDDLLLVGLQSSEIAGDVELFPKIEPPAGRSVEDCLRIIRAHLVRQLENPVPAAQSLPTGSWEARARFPELHQFLGSYFHQDFFDEYASRDDRNQLATDISRLLTLAGTDGELKQAVSLLGMEVSPPAGADIRRWLRDVHGTVSRYPEA
ncbi:contact-dependent growth inhibition system immunity protein [Streptomyces sp. NPDC059906]|uniref:contact-dependent growth inhibition system immunity protein n=1 Tax=Streptomyces sp. NPDC059906 TaxID=3346997 RepID=UPI0036553AEE